MFQQKGPKFRKKKLVNGYKASAVANVMVVLFDQRKFFYAVKRKLVYNVTFVNKRLSGSFPSFITLRNFNFPLRIVFSLCLLNIPFIFSEIFPQEAIEILLFLIQFTTLMKLLLL